MRVLWSARLFLLALALCACTSTAQQVKDLRRDADAGDSAAQFALGKRYAEGDGVERDAPQAAALFRKAADAENADAQVALGMLYRDGLGVAQDPQEALRWIRKAADSGNARAQYLLGMIYEDGDGVPRDLVAAHAWYNLAAAGLPPADRPQAVRQRDWLTAVLTPPQLAEAQRLAREWAARSK